MPILLTKRHIVRFIPVCIFAQIGLTSCNKSVDINPPTSGLVSTTVYNTNQTATAAVTGIYYNMIITDGLCSGFSGISTRQGLAADELTLYGFTNAILAQFYQNSLSSLNSYYWNELYQRIYECNAVIEGINKSQTISGSVKQRLNGEAKFLRAFFLFYGANLYGDIPMPLSTDYKVNNSIEKTSKAQVFAQVISDLLEAQTDLTDNFVDAGGNTTSERTRPCKGAATALLARVYLYMDNWQSAITESSKLVENPQYKLNDDLNQVFLANSTEAIWQLQPVQPTYNTYDGYNFVLSQPPGQSSLQPLALSDSFSNSFEHGDLRGSNWVGTLVSGNSIYKYPFKYKIRTIGPGDPVTEYLMVLRLAEQYLIRAEAEANIGGSYLGNAIIDLNTIRNRAGLPNYSGPPDNKDSILAAIMHERRVELFTEWGHRWFDLIRTNQANMVIGTICPLKGGSWNQDWQLCPIPQSEISINPKLVQNPGYQ